MNFSIKYRYCDILLKKYKLHVNRFFCCNHTRYCVNMVSVTSVSRYITSVSCYHPRYQSRSSVYAGFAEVVPIDHSYGAFNKDLFGILYENVSRSIVPT